MEIAKNMKRLGVVTHDLRRIPKGLFSDDVVKEFLNPKGFFDEVYQLTPYVDNKVFEHGMTIIPTPLNQYKKIVKALNLNMVRAHGGKKCCDLVCNNKIKGVSVMVSVHDERPSYINPSIAKADVVLYSSIKVKRHIRRYFKNIDKLWPLPAKVDFTQMKPLNLDNSKLNKMYPFKYKVLQVGRKAKVKNIDTLIQALSILGEDYCLIAIGRSSPIDLKLLQAMVKSFGVKHRCLLKDRIFHNEIPKFMNWATCICNPSRSEGHSRAIIEAMACGAVVVTSAIESNSYIKNKINALLVNNVEDPKELAEAISLACTDSVLRKTIKSNSRDCVKQFEKKHIDTIEVEYYRKALQIGMENAVN